MVSGFFFAWIIYTDHRDFCAQTIEALEQIKTSMAELKGYHKAEQ